jgi:hypothetical protein
MQKSLKVCLGGIALIGAAIGLVAVTPTPSDRSRDASRIIESLALPQKAMDKIPAQAREHLPLKIDASLTRLVGEGRLRDYYAVPVDEKICMIPVAAGGRGDFIGCTTLEGFESYGLRMENAEGTEQAWLVIPSGADSALESVKNEEGWTKQAPNLLLRETTSD